MILQYLPAWWRCLRFPRASRALQLTKCRFLLITELTRPLNSINSTVWGLIHLPNHGHLVSLGLPKGILPLQKSFEVLPYLLSVPDESFKLQGVSKRLLEMPELRQVSQDLIPVDYSESSGSSTDLHVHHTYIKLCDSGTQKACSRAFSMVSWVQIPHF